MKHYQDKLAFYGIGLAWTCAARLYFDDRLLVAFLFALSGLFVWMFAVSK